MHWQCGSMWSPIFSTPTAPMQRRRRRCIGDASATRRDLPTSPSPIPSGRPLAGEPRIASSRGEHERPS
eukprot:8686170-Pyramimonas_sp.AAC.1